MAQQSFIDASKPNAGRIYDYLLGGSHNFNIDRTTGDRLRQLAPFLPKAMRLQRWCLRDLAIELSGPRDYDVIIDFASGLPTNDHIHHAVRPGTTVIYSDFDPVVVEYAREILAGAENTFYFLADARHPEELLERQEVKTLVGNGRNVAFIFWGVSGFMNDEEISHAVQFLYNWSGPDSCLCFNAQGTDMGFANPGLSKLLSIYEQMKSPLHPRNIQEFQKLIAPWGADEKGFISLAEWHSMGPELFQENEQNWGPSGGGYGVFLTKQMETDG